MSNSNAITRNPRRLEIHFIKQVILPVRWDESVGLCPARNLATGAQVCSQKQRAVLFSFYKAMGVFVNCQITSDVILYSSINYTNNEHSPGEPTGVHVLPACSD